MKSKILISELLLLPLQALSVVQWPVLFIL